MNTTASQDDLVTPLLDENHYTFNALKGTAAVKKAYGVSGVPTEFLIDKGGQITAKVRLSSDDREKLVGKMIEELLAK